MKFTTKNNLATRVSSLVTINTVNYFEDSRSIVVMSSDGHRRVCKIDNCESLALARDLYRNVKSLIGQRATFYAAGGNDPSRWFFAVEGVVYDDSPDYIFGMKVEEPEVDYAAIEAEQIAELAEERSKRVPREEVVVHTLCEIVKLRSKYVMYKASMDVHPNEWYYLGMDMVRALDVLQAHREFGVSNGVIDDINDIIAIHKNINSVV